MIDMKIKNPNINSRFYSILIKDRTENRLYNIFKIP